MSNKKSFKINYWEYCQNLRTWEVHLAIFFLPVTLTKIHHCCRLLFFWNLYDSRQCRRFHSFHASKNAKYLSIRNNSPLFLSSIDSSFSLYSPMSFSPFLPLQYTVQNHIITSTQYKLDVWESKSKTLGLWR